MLKKAVLVHFVVEGYPTLSTYGKNFQWKEDKDNGVIHLDIDLSNNLRTSQKDTNLYYDCVDLLKAHKKIKSIQLNEKGVVDELLKGYNKAVENETQFSINLNFGDVSHSYKALDGEIHETHSDIEVEHMA